MDPLCPEIGQDTVILPGTTLLGNTNIGEDCIIGQDLVVSSLYPVIYGAVVTGSPAFSVNLLTATYGGTTTSGILNANWNQKFNIRAAQVQIVEVN